MERGDLLQVGHVKGILAAGRQSGTGRQAEQAVKAAALKKAECLSVGDAVALIGYELDVSQFAAQETLIKACASRDVWSRVQFPNGSEILFCFTDPRWWRLNLDGIKIPREHLNGGLDFEVAAPQYLIQVQDLLAWLTKSGWLAKKGQIEWYPLIGGFGPVYSKKFLDATKNKMAIVPDSLVSAVDDALPMASDPMIDRAISDVYNETERDGLKPPNVKEIASLVQSKLTAQGRQSSGHRIQKLAEADRYKKRRRKPGPTLASEKRRHRS